MKIHIIKYDGTEIDLEYERFEIRCNHVVNWIHVFFNNGTDEYIHDFCVVRGE